MPPHCEIDREWMTRLALSIDTVMSNAFLRALGVPVPMRAVRGAIVRTDMLDRYSGVEHCMRNETTAMDVLYGA